MLRIKIKIIDLLNKIANGEEVPKKIRFDNINWNKVYGEKYMYYKNDYDSDLFLYFFRKNLDFTLNDEVEIIEEPKKIEKLEPVRGSYLADLTSKNVALKNNSLIELCKTLKNRNNKINELIDEINNLKEK